MGTLFNSNYVWKSRKLCNLDKIFVELSHESLMTSSMITLKRYENISLILKTVNSLSCQIFERIESVLFYGTDNNIDEMNLLLLLQRVIIRTSNDHCISGKTTVKYVNSEMVKIITFLGLNTSNSPWSTKNITSGKLRLYIVFCN